MKLKYIVFPFLFSGVLALSVFASTLNTPSSLSQICSQEDGKMSILRTKIPNLGTVIAESLLKVQGNIYFVARFHEKHLLTQNTLADANVGIYKYSCQQKSFSFLGAQDSNPYAITDILGVTGEYIFLKYRSTGENTHFYKALSLKTRALLRIDFMDFTKENLPKDFPAFVGVRDLNVDKNNNWTALLQLGTQPYIWNYERDGWLNSNFPLGKYVGTNGKAADSTEVRVQVNFPKKTLTVIK